MEERISCHPNIIAIIEFPFINMFLEIVLRIVH